MFFFFNDTATTEIYTLSLHDALPISAVVEAGAPEPPPEPEHRPWRAGDIAHSVADTTLRSEEHTSELQSH